MDAHAFLQNLALVLCVAAVTTVVFARLRQPVVFGYLLAGMIVGPHLPVPLVADERMVRALAELGVILLMYSLGLEFSVKKVGALASTSGLAALAETSVMFGLGHATADALGWSVREQLFTGAMVAISSTTIIARSLAEQRVGGRQRELVFGILIMEDVIAIVLIAVLSGVAAGAAPTAGAIGLVAVRLATFLVALVGVGLVVLPRLMRYVVRLDRPEITVVAGVGVCFAAALLALGFGYSVALGAFLAGALVAESGHGRAVEHLVAPIRDVFVAIFFVAVGMLLDPRAVVAHWPAVVALTLVVVVGKVLAVSAGAFLAGNGLTPSIRAGMTLAQIGEFSFILAGVGVATGAIRGFLYPVAVAVSAITTLTTPWLMRAGPPVAQLVDRKLPKPLQTFAALYGSWIERMRAAPTERGAGARVRTLVRKLLLDAALLAGLAVAAAAEMGRFALIVQRGLGVGVAASRGVVVGVALLAAVPFVLGLVRTTRALAVELALRALPTARTGLDRALAPRRALTAALHAGLLLAVALPLVAALQPLLPRLSSVALLAGIAATLGAVVWQSAANLQGHARAGAEVIALALLQHDRAHGTPDELTRTTERLVAFLPGLGEPELVRLAPGDGAVGCTLGELDLRGRTGATVLAITRTGADGEASAAVPTAGERLRAGDVLALAGATEAIEAARTLLVLPDAPAELREI